MAINPNTLAFIQDAFSSWEFTGRKLQGDESISWQQARNAYRDKMAELLPPADDVTIERITLGGVPAVKLTPPDGTDGRAVFYMHGGGYVHGNTEMYFSVNSILAKRLNAVVYLPDYRQAPEFVFPTPIEDVFAAYRGLLEAGQDPKKLALAGDSAGGALVVTIMRWAKSAGLPLPAGGVAFSPWADLSHSGESAVSRNSKDIFGSTVEPLQALADIFVGGESVTHPDASPMFADVGGLSPILIQTGEKEVMLSGAVKLAENLAYQQVRVNLEVYPEMFHVWQIFAGRLPEADDAVDSAVAFLEKAYRQAS